MLGWVAWAWAQGAVVPSEGAFDAHAWSLAPQGGDVLDPLRVWRPVAWGRHAATAQALVEFAERPLVRVADGGGRVPVVDDLLAVNLGVGWAPHPRVAIQAALPVVLAQRGPLDPEPPGVADLRLSVPVGLVLPGDAGGVGASVVPFADLPTGQRARWRGDGGAGGALIAVGYAGRAFSVDANVGYRHAGARALANLPGGGQVLAGVAGAVAPTPWLGVRAEVVLAGAVQDAGVAGTAVPVEGIVSARGRHGPGLTWTVGASTALSPGAGAALVRAFAGFGWTRPGARDRDGDGRDDAVDACPAAAEVVNGWQDDDGCPDALATWTVVVVDPDGQPVPDARVSWDGFIGYTGPDGALVQSDVPGALRAGRVDADGWTGASFDAGALVEGAQRTTVRLDWLPGTVRVRVEGEDGTPLAARLAFSGPLSLEPVAVPPEGRIVVMPPGGWTVHAQADGWAGASRVVVVTDKRARLDLRFALGRAVVRVDGDVITPASPISFVPDTDAPTAEGVSAIRAVATALLMRPELRRVAVVGEGTLGAQRAERVRAWLVALGVPAARLAVEAGAGLGDTVALLVRERRAPSPY